MAWGLPTPERALRVAAGREVGVGAVGEAEVLARAAPEERVAVPIGAPTWDRARPLDSEPPRVAVPGAEAVRRVDSPLLVFGFSADRTGLVFALMGSWSCFKVWLHPLPTLAAGRRCRLEISGARGGKNSSDTYKSRNGGSDEPKV